MAFFKLQKLYHMIPFLKHPHEIKMFGLQRSGTNLVKRVVELNYNAVVYANVGGWKHGHHIAPFVLGRYLDCLLITKNPYAWLTSMHRYLLKRGHQLQDCSGQFEEFVRSPLRLHGWQGTKAGTHDMTFWCQNPVQYWNEMHHHWLALHVDLSRNSHRRLCHVKYEDLLGDAEHTIRYIGLTLQIPMKSDGVEWEQTELLPGKDERLASASSDFTRVDYYMQRQYLSEYSPSLLRFVNDEIDPTLLPQLGYGLVESPKGTAAPV